MQLPCKSWFRAKIRYALHDQCQVPASAFKLAYRSQLDDTLQVQRVLLSTLHQGAATSGLSSALKLLATERHLDARTKWKPLGHGSCRTMINTNHHKLWIQHHISIQDRLHGYEVHSPFCLLRADGCSLPWCFLE